MQDKMQGKCFLEIRMGGDFVSSCVSRPTQEIHRVEWNTRDPGFEAIADFIQEVMSQHYPNVRVTTDKAIGFTRKL